MTTTLRVVIMTAAVAVSGIAPELAAQVPAEPIPLSLEAAVEMALANNPRAAQAGAGEEMAAAKLTQARSTWLPGVEASQTWSRGDHPVFVFGSLLEQGRFGPENFDPSFLNDPPTLEHYRLALDIQVPIFDQLGRASTISQARLGLEGARTDVSSVRQQLRLGTLQAYYGVLVARRALAVARSAVEAAESDVSVIRDKFETGLVVQSDLLAAEVQLAEFRQQEISAAGNVAVATAQLRAILDLPPGRQIELVSQLPETEFDVLMLDEQLEIGIASHPELERARLDARSAALELRKARGRFLPRLDGFASVARNGDSFGENLSDDQLVGLRLSWSLLEPGRAGRVAEASAGRNAAEAEVAALENEVTVRIIAAWEDLQAASQRLDVARRSLEQAREAVRIIRDRYEEGLVTITEQLRAQTAVTRAELNHLAAIQDKTIGYARVLWATGRLEHVQPFIN